MPEFPESIKPQVNQPNRSEQQNQINRFEQLIPPQQMDDIIAGLNYEGLVNQREQITDRLILLNTNPDNLETVLKLQVLLEKINAKIKRFEDIEQIKSTSFDAQNIAKFEAFIKDGKPMVARNVDGEDYLVIHGNIQPDENGINLHFVDTEQDQPVETFGYITEQLKNRQIIPNNNVLKVASCYFGEMDKEIFKAGVESIKQEYGVEIVPVISDKGKVGVEVVQTPKQRLEELKKAGINTPSNVSFQAV